MKTEKEIEREFHDLLFEGVDVCDMGPEHQQYYRNWLQEQSKKQWAKIVYVGESNQQKV